MRSPESDFTNLPFIFAAVTFLCILNMILVFELSLDLSLYANKENTLVLLVSSLAINTVWAAYGGDRKLSEMLSCFILYAFTFYFFRDLHFWGFNLKEEVIVSFKTVSLVFLSEYFYYVIFLSFLNSLNHNRSSYFDFYNLFCLLVTTFVINSSHYTSFDSVFIRLVLSIVTYQMYDFLLHKLAVRRRAIGMKSKTEKVVLL